MSEFVQLLEFHKKYVEIPQAEYRRNDKLAVTKEDRKELYKNTKKALVEGLAELNKLKLSPVEKNGISNYRKFFKEAIRACDAGIQGKEAKSLRIMHIADNYARKYEAILYRIGAMY